MAKVNYKIKKGIQIMIKEGPISLTKKIHCSIKKNNISIIKPPYEMLSNIQFKKGYIDRKWGNIYFKAGLRKFL